MPKQLALKQQVPERVATIQNALYTVQKTFGEELRLIFSQVAFFKARIQEGGIIRIPEEEIEALGLKEGDYVEVVIIPVKKSV